MLDIRPHKTTLNQKRQGTMSHDEIETVRLCIDTSTSTHCGTMLSARQLRQKPTLAENSGTCASRVKGVGLRIQGLGFSGIVSRFGGQI